MKNNKKNKTYVQFLESDSINCLMYSPTQVGKTNATREFIETCFKNNVPVVVSTDNKTDQQEQLRHRIQNDLCGADVTLMSVCDKSFVSQFTDCIVQENYRFVIFCLDNASQIDKLISAFANVYFRQEDKMKLIKKFAIIHDEADVVTKVRIIPIWSFMNGCL